LPHYSSKGSSQYPTTDCQSILGRRRTSSQPAHPADLSAPRLYLIYDNCTSEVSEIISLELENSISTSGVEIPELDVSVQSACSLFTRHGAGAFHRLEIEESRPHACRGSGQTRSVGIQEWTRLAIRRRSRKHATVGGN
jgi:hypothetical protein